MRMALIDMESSNLLLKLSKIFRSARIVENSSTPSEFKSKAMPSLPNIFLVRSVMNFGPPKTCIFVFLGQTFVSN